MQIDSTICAIIAKSSRRKSNLNIENITINQSTSGVIAPCSGHIDVCLYLKTSF